MTKNHYIPQEALFEPLEYLADVPMQCDFIEKNFYLESNFSSVNNPIHIGT
jgi:hypothetical protein